MGKAIYVTNLSLVGIYLFHKAPWPAISCRGTSSKRETVAICNSVTLQNFEKQTARTLTPLTLKKSADSESCHLHDKSTLCSREAATAHCCAMT